MSARFRFNNHHERKMYNRKKHRRRSVEARELEEPQYAPKVIPNKKADRRWKYEEGFDDEE